MPSHQTTAAQSTQPDQPDQPDQSARPEASTRNQSDDTILVWREVKYYHAFPQASGNGTDRLYADFREAFDGWTKERFQNLPLEALRALKYTLRSGGVYTGNIRKQAAEALADLAQLPRLEDGLWPSPPKWDRTEFMEMKFNPKSQAHATQTAVLEWSRRQLGQQPQPGPPRIPSLQQFVGAPPQIRPSQGPSSDQQSVQQPFPAPPQGPPVLGPPTGPGTANTQGSTQHPAGAQNQSALVTGPPARRLPPQVMRRMAAAQRWALQGQQQPGLQPQPNQPPSGAIASQPPPPYSPQAPQVNNTRFPRSESQPVFSNPFAQAALQRTAANPRRRIPAARSKLSPRAVQNDQGNGSSQEDEEEMDVDEDEDEDEDDDEDYYDDM